MGVYVSLRNQRGEYIPFKDASLIRLHYAAEIIRYFYEGRVFVPESIQVWMGFPSKTLGGQKKVDREVSEPFKDIALIRQELISGSYSFEQLLSTVIVISGSWDLAGNKLAGFISVNNNPAWRRVYRDIEIDAHGSGDIEDLVDMLWKSENREGIISDFIKKIKASEKEQKLVPYEIFFSIGAPVKGEVESLMAVHFNQRKALIDFLYSTASEKGDPDVRDKMPPLARDFFIGSIADQEIVNERLERTLQEAFIKEYVGNSVTYIAKERESFTKLYERFYKAVFKPAMSELPRSEEVKLRIKKGLEGTKSLD
jgi:hypothetical protein